MTWKLIFSLFGQTTFEVRITFVALIASVFFCEYMRFFFLTNIQYR